MPIISLINQKLKLNLPIFRTCQITALINQINEVKWLCDVIWRILQSNLLDWESSYTNWIYNRGCHIFMSQLSLSCCFSCAWAQIWLQTTKKLMFIKTECKLRYDTRTPKEVFIYFLSISSSIFRFCYRSFYCLN